MGETLTGVVDRFEGDQAVVLLESEGEVVDELVVDREDLPEDGRHDDAVLQLSLDEGEIVGIEYNQLETEDRREGAQNRFENLSKRPPSSDSNSN